MPARTDRGAIDQIRADELGLAFKMMARVARVQIQLIQSWEILSTMTPFDYAEISRQPWKVVGLSVVQYRTLEFRLGNKNVAMARVFEADRRSPSRCALR